MHFINKQKNYTFTIIRVSVTKYTHHIHIIETISVEKKLKKKFHQNIRHYNLKNQINNTLLYLHPYDTIHSTRIIIIANILHTEHITLNSCILYILQLRLK